MFGLRLPFPRLRPPVPQLLRPRIVAVNGALRSRPLAALARLISVCPAPRTPLIARRLHQHPPALIRPSLCPPPPPPRSPLQARLRRNLSDTPRRRYYDPNDPRLRYARAHLTSGHQPSSRRRRQAPSNRAIVVLAMLSALAFYFHNLETVPVSGRRRFNAFGEGSVRVLGEMQYKQLLRELEEQGGRLLSGWDWRDRMVRRVMDRLIPVSGMDDAEWEVHVIDDPRIANAFVLPGGKVFVFSGIFQFARNEDALAAVLGHEIAHNLAGHVAERMSQNIGTFTLYYSAILLSFAFPPAFLATYFFGGSLIGALFESPMSRLQESEADFIGLMMMAEACYNPEAALAFWMRMDQSHGDQQPPEWMSTHPSHQHRIEKIQGWMQKALDKRAESDCHGTQGFAEMFKRALRRGEIIVI